MTNATLRIVKGNVIHDITGLNERLTKRKIQQSLHDLRGAVIENCPIRVVLWNEHEFSSYQDKGKKWFIAHVIIVLEGDYYMLGKPTEYYLPSSGTLKIIDNDVATVGSIPLKPISE